MNAGRGAWERQPSSTDARPTCALVAIDQVFVRRNGIVGKLEGYGLKVKKEMQPSKAYAFDAVDCVVAVVDHLTRGQVDVLKAEAERCGQRPLFLLPHQTSKPEWAAMRRWVGDRMAGVDGVAASESLADPSVEELVALYESERDEARAQSQKLAGEVGTLRSELSAERADRTRLEAEAADLKGRAVKAEADAEAARLGAGEARGGESARVRALSDAVEALKDSHEKTRVELEAAVAANRALLRERDAAREAVARGEDRGRSAEKDAKAIEVLQAEVTVLKKNLAMAKAREAKNVQVRAETLSKIAIERDEAVAARRKAERGLEEALSQERKTSSGDLANAVTIAGAYAALVAAKAMPAEEAFGKTLAALGISVGSPKPPSAERAVVPRRSRVDR